MPTTTCANNTVAIALFSRLLSLSYHVTAFHKDDILHNFVHVDADWNPTCWCDWEQLGGELQAHETLF